MANWAVIINDIIEEFHDDVPHNWRHISGLKISAHDLEFMASHGWYPIDNNSIIDDSVVDHVGRAANSEIKHSFINELKDIIERIIRNTDRTQLRDYVVANGAKKSDEWGKYRNKIRELLVKHLTDDIINISNVKFPDQPEN